MEEVERLAREQRFDYLLIESTGISEAHSRGPNLFVCGRGQRN